MTFIKSSDKNNSSIKCFNSMFWQSVRKSFYLSLAAFLVFLFFTAINGYEIHSYYNEINLINTSTGQFWEMLLSEAAYNIMAICFMLAGLINGIILFGFVSSKKQSNVIFSLGMTRKQIFVSRILAGAIPMTVSIALGGLIELITTCSYYGFSVRTLQYALFWDLTVVVIYLTAFIITCAVLSNVGNIIEGLIFTVIISAFPYLANLFYSYFGDSFTLGYLKSNSNFEWYNIFHLLNKNLELLSDYFSQNEISIKISNYAGIIESICIIAVIFVISMLTFCKHKNEIAGTWGRAKGLNEICGVMIGSCFFSLLLRINTHGNGKIISFIISLIAFFVGYLVFKLIFGNRRKQILLKSFKTLPVYAVAFGAIIIIFSTGLFGYSSYIPKESDIATIQVDSQLWAYSQQDATDSQYGLINPEVQNKSYSQYYFENNYIPKVVFNSPNEFKKVIDIHKSIIKDGKIKDSVSNACGTYFSITYTLKNNKEVTRYYTETTTETAKKVISLNDSDTYKSTIFSQNEQSYDYMDPYKFSVMSDYFIFSTDMYKGHYAGVVDSYFYDALKKDIMNISSNETFYHSGDDEIGIIIFSPNGSWASSYAIREKYGDYYIGNNGDYYSVDTSEFLCSAEEAEELSSTSNELLNYQDFDGEGNAIVITKSMKNTIEYLQKHDLLKYMEKKFTSGDIKYAKVATRGELLKNKSSSSIHPIFYAGYCDADTVKEADKAIKEGLNHYVHQFAGINDEITNKTTIQKLMNVGFTFGYCDNSYKIVELTHNDGSISTICISSEEYDKIIG